MKVIFRDNNPEVSNPVKALFPEWDVACGDIFGTAGADIVVSPANVTGRMDGGIDQIYINRFGWQLEARLMRDILNVHHGKLPIGEARLITTYDERTDAIPLMICAPTMAWPPQDVSRTENAYLAFKATLVCALTEGVKALGREPTLLLPGLGTATGRMSGERCAEQMRRAWDEVMANPPPATRGILFDGLRIENSQFEPGVVIRAYAGEAEVYAAAVKNVRFESPDPALIQSLKIGPMRGELL